MSFCYIVPISGHKSSSECDDCELYSYTLLVQRCLYLSLQDIKKYVCYGLYKDGSSCESRSGQVRSGHIITDS